MKRNDLSERLFIFSVDVIKYTRLLPDSYDYRVIKYQLVKSATSAGANYEESQSGSSRADFSNKIKIALREMRESNYWLRMVNAIEENQVDSEKLEALIDESLQLKKILGAISNKTRVKK